MYSYVYTTIIIDYIVPLLRFNDVYTLTHTCTSLRQAIDWHSTLWKDVCQQLSIATHPNYSNLLAKRLLLAHMPRVCWACWRPREALSMVRDANWREHTLCIDCLPVTRDLTGVPKRLRDTVRRVRRVVYGIEAKNTYYIHADVNQMLDARSRNLPLLELPPVPYMMHGRLAVRRHGAAEMVVYSNECVCGVQLASHEALMCRYNSCRKCCLAIRSPIPCRRHRRRTLL